MKLTKNHSRLLVCSLSLFVLPVAFAKDMDKKFAKLDTNNDGLISRAEHTAGAQQMFAELDANRDGAVTAAEMDAKKDTKRSGHEELSASEKIKEIDQNGDGRLTSAEHSTGSAAKFDKMDTNQDGSLSKTELEAGHKMKKK